MVPQDSLSLDPAAQRDRMGRYVRALLWQDDRLQAVGWPLDVGWSESGVWASRTRARGWADRLAEVLVRTQEEFADADETGRRRVLAWRSANGRIEWNEPDDGSPIELILEPGIFLREEMGGSRPLVHRRGDVAGISPQEAIERGWMRMG